VRADLAARIQNATGIGGKKCFKKDREMRAKAAQLSSGKNSCLKEATDRWTGQYLERQRKEQAERAEQFRKEQEEARQKEEADRRYRAYLRELPTYKLGNSYANYIWLRRCATQREGYAVVFISPAEMERARVAVKRIEQKLAKDGKVVAPDENDKTWTIPELWQRAIEHTSLWPEHIESNEGREICQRIYVQLIDRYRKTVPEDHVERKDF
jgi:hypothetical protein